jgi:hypothetical protein
MPRFLSVLLRLVFVAVWLVKVYFPLPGSDWGFLLALVLLGGIIELSK